MVNFNVTITLLPMFKQLMALRQCVWKIFIFH